MLIDFLEVEVRSKEKAPTHSTALRSGITDMKSRDVDKSAPFIQH